MVWHIGPKDRAENVRTLIQSLRIDKIPDADAVALAVFNAPADVWIAWDERQPRVEDGEIVGMDCLGFIHRATHLIGSGNGMWVEKWMRLP